MRLCLADAQSMFICAAFWWLTTSKCPPIDFLPLSDDLTLQTSTFDAMDPMPVPKIDDHDDNNYEHLWSSGTTYPCHGWDPGSIPGKCTFWLLVFQILPIFLYSLLWYDQSDTSLECDDRCLFYSDYDQTVHSRLLFLQMPSWRQDYIYWWFSLIRAQDNTKQHKTRQDKTRQHTSAVDDSFTEQSRAVPR